MAAATTVLTQARSSAWSQMSLQVLMSSPVWAMQDSMQLDIWVSPVLLVSSHSGDLPERMGPEEVVPAHYDKRVRELAYEIWRTDTRQIMRDVAKKLAELGEGEIPADTVSDWRVRDGWQARWTDERQALSPRMLEKYVEGLRVAAPEMVQKLRAHVQSSSHTDENGNYLDENHITMSQVQAAKTILAENRAAIGLMLVAGSSADARKPLVQPTMAELQEREQQLRALSSHS